MSKLLFFIFLFPFTSESEKVFKYGIYNNLTNLWIRGSKIEPKTHIWILEPMELGRFRFINAADGTVLERNIYRNNLVMVPKSTNVNQQWYINSDGTIVNAGPLFLKNPLAIEVGPKYKLYLNVLTRNAEQVFEFKDPKLKNICMNKN